MHFCGKLFSYFFLFINVLVLYVFDPFVQVINISDFNIVNVAPEYDFIVVGSGSAGCVVASRLLEDNFTVLLMEAGGSDRIMPPLDPVKLSFTMAIVNETEYIFNYIAKYKYFNKTFVRSAPRGKMFGGTGTINMQMWNKGNKAVYDHWESLGNEGWNSKNLSYYFKKVEDKMHIIKEPIYFHEISNEMLKTARKIYGSFEDPHEKEEGFGNFSSSAKGGFRHTSCDAYLKPLLSTDLRKNFHIKLNSFVTRLIPSENNKDEIVGIEYISAQDLEKENKEFSQVRAKYEVIISAGAYDSPALLMRSGIGNSKELQALNIPVLKHLPGVGNNYQNHYTIPITYKAKKTGWSSVYMNVGLQNFFNAWKHGKGPLTTQGTEFQGFFKSNYSKYPNVSDFHYLCGPIMGSNKGEDMPDWYQEEPMFSCIIILATPKNSGFVKIKSKNPAETPEINGVFVKDEDDLKGLYQAFLNIKKLFEHKELKDHFQPIFPDVNYVENLQSFSKYAQEKFYAIFHPSGTCKMGNIEKDKMAVVNSELKIHGLKGVRVIDASIMPEITTTNLNAPVIMLAEKGVDMIRREYKKNK